MHLKFRSLLFVMSFLTIAVAHADDSSRQDAQPLSAALRMRCLKILRAGLQSKEFWPAMHAAEALSLAGAGDEVTAALLDRLSQEKDDQHRCGLARELVRAGERKHTETLFQILGDPQSTGRVHAAESLYKIGEVGDGRLLRAAMTQSDVIPLQMMAAGALAKSGDANAFSLLRQNLRSEEVTTRNLSAWILGRLGNDSDIEPLLAAMNDENEEMPHTFLAVALACRGHEKGRRELGRHLDSQNATARAMATEFAGHSRSIEFREKLIELLDDSALDVRVRSAQSLIALSISGTNQ